MIVNAIPRANFSECVCCGIKYDLARLRPLSAGFMDGLAPARMDGRALGDSALAAAGYPAGVPTIIAVSWPSPLLQLLSPRTPPSPMTFIADRHLFM